MSYRISSLKLGFTLRVALSFLLICAFARGETTAPSGSVRSDGRLDFVCLDGSIAASIVIEIADDMIAQTKGLMGRRSLNVNEGMLFVYQQESVRQFWMHNTPISLDIIFVDNEKRIIHMAKSTRPLSTQRYSSQKPAQYVVEVAAGFVKQFNIEKGMQIQWQRVSAD